MGYRFEVLGSPRVRQTDGAREVDLPLGKPLALLAYLVVERRPVPREELGHLLWPGSDESHARHSVRQAIWLLRKKLGEAALEGDDPVEASSALDCDLRDFDLALRERDMVAARRLWRGPLLSRLHLPECKEWELWLEERRDLLSGRYFQALLDTGRRLRESGELDEAIPVLEVAVALNPYSLAARALHFECLLDLRRIAPARDALEEARRAVGDQEGAGPSLGRMEERLALSQERIRTEEPERLGEVLEFVGRSDELADLNALWRRAQGGRPGVVSLMGPTGIGKTRLAREFLAQVEGGGGRVAQARGYRGEEEIAWGTVADLVRELMSSPGSAGVSSASDALLRSILPSLAVNGSAASASAAPSPAALADAVTDLLEAVGFEHPIAIFVDDFQWVDPESRALLANVIRRMRTTPVMFLLAERTGEGDRGSELRAQFVAAELGGRRLRLRSLGAEEVAEALGLLFEFSVPDQAGHLGEELHRVSGGNPLFLGELLRKLAAEGVCRFEHGRWLLDAERFPAALALPASIQALVEERLERLSPQEKQVVVALAGERRSVPARHLRMKSGLDEGAFGRALADLVSNEVLVWVTGDVLDFAHDQLREAASLRFSGRPERARDRGWWGGAPGLVAVAALVALVLLGGGQIVRLLAGGGLADPPTYPYGKGRIAVLGDSSFALVPPDREGGEWRVEPLGIWEPSEESGVMVGPYPTRYGQYRWLGYHRVEEDPPFAAEFLPDGEVRVLHSTRGDAGALDLSPDDRTVLIASQDSLAAGYSIDLLALDLETGEKRTLFLAPEMIRGARWSPDGTRIAMVYRSRVDTLLVMTPEGRVMRTLGFPDYEAISRVSWCRDSRHLVLFATNFGEQGGLLLDLAGEDPPVEFGWDRRMAPSVACLGNARGAVFLAVGEEGGVPHVLDFSTGEVTPVGPAINPGGIRLWWVKDDPPAPVRSVRVREGDLELAFAQRRLLTLEGVRWDETRVELEAVWQSRDPSVASVTAGGSVTGNRAGETVLVGEYAGWLRDSVRVRVVDDGAVPEEVLFRDTFGVPTLPDWQINSDPAPQVVQLEGGPVLELRGNGRYRDHIRTRRGISMLRGATLEMEFRLPLTRRDRQHLAVCLTEAVPKGAAALWRVHGSLCFRYPYDEGVKFRDDLALVTAGWRPVRPPDVSHWLPRDGWVHLALQIRPDGTASIFLDRELLVHLEYRFDLRDDPEWFIDLEGFAEDTDLYVRNLVLWRGERF